MAEVPTFVKGEPGFASKLNALGDVVRELQTAIAEHLESHKAAEVEAPAEPPKAPAKATTTRKTATASK